jgi:O-antigen/teichoic acid export membrane protein
MALLRHSGIYFLARILAGGASFAVISAYTRLLDPHAFGEYALSLAGVAFFSGLIVYGPMLAMLRYLPSHSQAARATTLWGLTLPACAICGVAIVVILLAAPGRWQLQLVLCAALLIATLLHQFQLATAQGALEPGRYALLGSLESALDMLVGIGLVALGYGVPGALLGTTLATVAAVAVNWRSWWINWKFFDPVLGQQMLRFCLPLVATALFGWLGTFGDRWLLGLYVGANQAGLYSASYDLQMNMLGVPLAVMQLAGYPLAISALSEHGVTAARQQLRLLGAFLILFVLPEAVGIVMTGPLLVNIFLGAEFRPLALSLLPVLVSVTVLKALISYVINGYFLAARTGRTLLSIVAAAVIDIVLNLILIPHYGVWGSAMAALVASGAGLAVAVILMRGVFAFPLPDPVILIGGLLGVAAMAAWLSPFYLVTAWSALFYVIPVAVLVYFGAVFLVLHLAGRKPLDLMLSSWNGGEAGRKAAL